MPATDMLDMIGLRNLFDKAQSGDQEAARVVQNLNRNPTLTGQAFASKAEMAPINPIATTLMQDLPKPTHTEDMSHLISGGGWGEGAGMKPTGGGGVETKESHHPSAQNVLSALAVGFQDVGNAFGNSRAPIDSGLVADARKRLQEDQLYQLKKRHDMWDTAYQHSQEIPGEVLTDPRFSSLAQAKAALDKDMMDGKVDNEKNVSTFLTELARHRKDLDDYALQQKANQQIDLTHMLEQGGVQESLQDKLAREAKEKAAVQQGQLQRAQLSYNGRVAVAQENARARAQAAHEAAAARGASETNRQRHLAATGLRATLNDAAKRLGVGKMVDGPFDAKKGVATKVPMNPKAEDQMYLESADAIMSAAHQSGVPIREGHDYFLIGNRGFDKRNPQDKLDMIKYLAQVIGSGPDLAQSQPMQPPPSYSTTLQAGNDEYEDQ